MNIMPPLFFLILILLPCLSVSAIDEPRRVIGEDDTDEETDDTSPQPAICDCSYLTYDVDEMEGTLKNPGYPELYCNHLSCSYEIEGHPTLATILTLNTLDMEKHDHLYLYFVGIVNEKKEKIYLNDLAQREMYKYVAPPGIGFLLHLITDHSVQGRFLIEYKRAEGGLHDENGHALVCPYPFIEVNSTVQTIKVNEWTRIGCGIRLSSNYSIDFRGKCDYSYENGMWIRAAFQGEIGEYWSLSVHDYAKEKSTSATDIVVKGSSNYFGRRRSLNNCEISFYSLDYDPCNCSTTRFELQENVPLNLSSPGFPFMLCSEISCSYTFTRAGLKSPLKNGFKISAIHFTHDYYDKLDFYDDKNVKIRQLDHDLGRQTAEEIFVTDSLRVDYVAPRAYKNQHGFTLLVEAINVMNECLCPSNLPKRLPTKGTFTMAIPPHCGDMKCRFEIPAISTYYRTSFRMMLNSSLQGDNENFAVETEGVTTTYTGGFGESLLKRYNAVTDKTIRLVYSRESLDSNATLKQPSSFNITWQWLNRLECVCEKHIFKAQIEQWDELFSPHYPEDYCLNMDCVYLIQAPVGCHVAMNVTFFQTEPHSDYLFFFDSFNTTLKHLLQLHGHVLVATPFESTTRNASLRFTSDASLTDKGFVVAFKAVKDPVEESESSWGLWIVLGVIFVMGGVLGAGGYVVYNKKIVSFRNPVYVPTVEYSNAGEDGELDG